MPCRCLPSCCGRRLLAVRLLMPSLLHCRYLLRCVPRARGARALRGSGPGLTSAPLADARQPALHWPSPCARPAATAAAPAATRPACREVVQGEPGPGGGGPAGRGAAAPGGGRQPAGALLPGPGGRADLRGWAPLGPGPGVRSGVAAWARPVGGGPEAARRWRVGRGGPRELPGAGASGEGQGGGPRGPPARSAGCTTLWVARSPLDFLLSLGRTAAVAAHC